MASSSSEKVCPSSVISCAKACLKELKMENFESRACIYLSDVTFGIDLEEY